MDAERVKVKARIISIGVLRREVLDIKTNEKGKRTSTTHHKRLMNGKWQRKTTVSS